MPALRPSRASTTPLRGLAGLIGIPEVSSGMPSPPLSPPLAARHTSASKSLSETLNRGRARRGGATCTITEQCERLFCETLRTVFLGEGDTARQDSLVMGVHNQRRESEFAVAPVDIGRHPDRLVQADGPVCIEGLAREYVEIWDYVGGNRFRGVVAETPQDKAMFIFFDHAVVGGDLKAGLMALLELCEAPYFTCSRLIVCIDRHSDPRARDALTKDLGWIGFQLTTLVDFTQADAITSDRWLFMDMDV